MSKPYYVKFKTATEIIEATFDALRQAKETGKIKTSSSHKRKILRIMEWITEGLDDELEGKGA